MGKDGGQRKRVAIAYHFFAHYRKAVMEELARHGRHEYVMYGDRGGCEPSIKVWDVPADVRFVHAKAWSVKGIVLQPRNISMALNPRLDVLIILGVAWYPLTWPAAVLGRLTGKRVLFWSHGWTRREGGLQGRVRRVYHRLAQGLLYYGHMAKALELENGTPAGRIHVIYNSLDYDAQRAARERVTREDLARVRRELFGDDQAPIAICTTRLIPVRRLDMLIDAAARLGAGGQRINLLLVGDGPERATLEALAKEKGVRTCFYGACYDEAVLAPLVMASNVMVAPGKVGLTAITSLTFGTPVVTHGNEFNQMPEWEAIIPDRTGSFFSDGDVDDLARAIGRWTASEWPDEAVRAECYRIIERFWNPRSQRMAIERAVDGLPADDLFWYREPGAEQMLPGRRTEVS
jgi:glycosyltransferase involved in cell wall biosynthesis